MRRSSLRKYVIQTVIITVVLWVGLTAAWNTRQMQHRMKCSANVVRIGSALSAYRNMHSGNAATLDALVDQGLIDPGELVCPAANDPRGNYRLAEPRSPRRPDEVLIYEPVDNHASGSNVLFADGDCKFVPADKLKDVISFVP